MDYKQNYYESLRRELVTMVERKLSPIALKYGYSQTGLEERIKWRPVVLLLGNYSSGKSTLINELLGQEIQKTGQAPTDDSFTVITHTDSPEPEYRDGMALLNDPEFPFSSLKKQGSRFVSHFKLSKVNSPFLENLALIDTPGMLDSVSERDRGYHYQEVIGEFANIADLILVLFDPHKAGTIRETYESLRKTIPRSTYEDRVLFVLNRVDECENLTDLLRVYGTLCWNLSQMTGRKDIPHIHLTYSHQIAEAPEFLSHLPNQRAELQEKILQAPKHRLDHLATYIEDHTDKLSIFLRTLYNYAHKKRLLLFKGLAYGLVVSTIVSLVCTWVLNPNFPNQPNIEWAFITGGIFIVNMLVWYLLTDATVLRSFYRNSLKEPKPLAQLQNQYDHDSWDLIEDNFKQHLKSKLGKVSLIRVRKDLKTIEASASRVSKEVRTALTEYYKLERSPQAPDLPPLESGD